MAERRILTVVATRLVEPWFECGLGVAGASRAWRCGDVAGRAGPTARVWG
jgi:hypothetical protein